jgi:hypothetical protein
MEQALTNSIRSDQSWKGMRIYNLFNPSPRWLPLTIVVWVVGMLCAYLLGKTALVIFMGITGGYTVISWLIMLTEDF